MLQSVTKYYKILQSITKTNVAHQLGPIFGLVLIMTGWPGQYVGLKSELFSPVYSLNCNITVNI